MKKQILLVISILVLAAVLAGCGRKAVWLPLLTTPGPGWTPSATLPIESTAPEAGAVTEDSLFATDAASMDNPKIIVTKSKHTLEVYDGDKLMARLQVALGRGEVGPKLKSGDNKTPEGDYYICKVSDQGKFYKSLFISYPNSDDANAGLASHIITQTQCDDITKDIENGKQPAWDTGLGGEIAINGTGTGGAGKTGDWTAGNISVSDKDMDYLWKYIKMGVDVQINP